MIASGVGAKRPSLLLQGVKNLIERQHRMVTLDPLFCDITWGAGGSTADVTMDIATAMQNKVGATARGAASAQAGFWRLSTLSASLAALRPLRLAAVSAPPVHAAPHGERGRAHVKGCCCWT